MTTSASSIPPSGAGSNSESTTPKIEEVFNFVKDGCSSLAARALGSTFLDPVTALKITGIVLAVIAAVLWISIVLNKHRVARLLNSKASSSRRGISWSKNVTSSTTPPSRRRK